MNLSKLMTSDERQRLNALNAQKGECLDRYQRCKTKLAQQSRQAVREWLSRLPEKERELCRVVLNNLVKAKQG
ncbi:hypothetical protein [Shewanella sp. MBTL60-007]|uniref:hypothetical protein n=1 Tax=Shewanella sp. MBTL60-007 TaxID=2815911 RepID=UPI001BC33089|nr:hypothetical protein [Shewanella sp. MBTL60-007]GIU13004.1 hypothetical protein TUM3792_02180 [Shewanella sp. MBTL60-007]